MNEMEIKLSEFEEIKEWHGVGNPRHCTEHLSCFSDGMGYHAHRTRESFEYSLRKQFNMGKYRAKPVVIDAFQWKDGNIEQLEEWANTGVSSGTLKEMISSPSIVYSQLAGRLVVRTASGAWQAVFEGWWIVRESLNPDRFYPCPDEEFQSKYERIED